MGKAPAFPLYASDFDMDTATWEPYEVGAYFRLLIYEWVNGSIPSDIDSIARIIREPLPDIRKRFNAKAKRIRCEFEENLKRNVLKKFSLNGNGSLINSRMEYVRNERSQFIESQREKGIKSAKKRWEGHITRVRTTVTNRLQPNDNLSSSSSSSSSSSKKNKESISHSDTKEFLSFYKEEFLKCFGTEPQIEWGKDGSITNKLLKTNSIEELKSLLESFFLSEDKFIRQSGYTIGVFKSQINKLKIGTASSHPGLRAWANEIMEEERDGRER